MRTWPDTLPPPGGPRPPWLALLALALAWAYVLAEVL